MRCRRIVTRTPDPPRDGGAWVSERYLWVTKVTGRSRSEADDQSWNFRPAPWFGAGRDPAAEEAPMSRTVRDHLRNRRRSGDASFAWPHLVGPLRTRPVRGLCGLRQPVDCDVQDNRRRPICVASCKRFIRLPAAPSEVGRRPIHLQLLIAATADCGDVYRSIRSASTPGLRRLLRNVDPGRRPVSMKPQLAAVAWGQSRRRTETSPSRDGTAILPRRTPA